MNIIFTTKSGKIIHAVDVFHHNDTYLWFESGNLMSLFMDYIDKIHVIV